MSSTYSLFLDNDLVQRHVETKQMEANTLFPNRVTTVYIGKHTRCFLRGKIRQISYEMASSFT